MFENLITNPGDIKKHWVEYFNDLLNGNTDFSPNLQELHSTASGEVADGIAVHPSYKEITLPIKRLKNPGVCG